MKYISLPLLLVAFASMLYMGTGQMILSGIDINAAQQQANAEISSSGKLTQITISSTDISSGKAVMIGNHEIRYDGKLYDIADRTTTAGKTILTVRWDEKEEGLISELCEHVENLFDNIPVHGKNTAHLLKNMGKDYLPHHHELSFSNPYISYDIVQSRNTETYESASAEIHSPPPQA